MKRLLPALLCALLLASCAPSAPAPADTTPATETQTEAPFEAVRDALIQYYIHDLDTLTAKYDPTVTSLLASVNSLQTSVNSLYKSYTSAQSEVSRLTSQRDAEASAARRNAEAAAQAQAGGWGSSSASIKGQAAYDAVIDRYAPIIRNAKQRASMAATYYEEANASLNDAKKTYDLVYGEYKEQVYAIFAEAEEALSRLCAEYGRPESDIPADWWK